MSTGAMTGAIPSQVAKAFEGARQLTPVERVTLAKLLLESVLEGVSDEVDWLALSLSSFQRDWDNAEDAIYDNWREKYGIPSR